MADEPTTGKVAIVSFVIAGRSVTTVGHTGVEQSGPLQPASQLHRRLPRAPTHAPWREQSLGQSARSHFAPL